MLSIDWWIYSFGVNCILLFFSTITGAGDGVFLKKDAPKGTIVALFNGIHITLEDTFRNADMKASVHKMWNDWESDEMVYIPSSMISLQAYDASLGMLIDHLIQNIQILTLGGIDLDKENSRISLLV